MNIKKILRFRYAAVACLVPVWASLLSGSSTEPAERLFGVAPKTRALSSIVCASASTEERELISLALHRAAIEHKLEPALLYAVIHRESRCEPKAKSSRGAIGLMQVRPDTAKLFGVSDPYALEGNIRAGSSYLAAMLKQFKGNIPLALAAYNAGPTKVRKFGRVPPYRETKSYVKTVLRTYAELNRITEI